MIKGISWASIERNPFDGFYPYMFATSGHNHSNNYIKSPAGQDIGMQVYGGNLEIVKDGRVILSISLA